MGLSRQSLNERSNALGYSGHVAAEGATEVARLRKIEQCHRGYFPKT
jgi:hypothetical protein